MRCWPGCHNLSPFLFSAPPVWVSRLFHGLFAGLLQGRHGQPTSILLLCDLFHDVLDTTPSTTLCHATSPFHSLNLLPLCRAQAPRRPPGHRRAGTLPPQHTAPCCIRPRYRHHHHPCSCSRTRTPPGAACHAGWAGCFRLGAGCVEWCGSLGHRPSAAGDYCPLRRLH